jgi:PKD domain
VGQKVLISTTSTTGQTGTIVRADVYDYPPAYALLQSSNSSTLDYTCKPAVTQIAVTTTDTYGCVTRAVAAAVNVTNIGPTISNITRISAATTATGNTVTIKVVFTDADTAYGDTHTISVNWDDGTAVTPITYISNTEHSHMYAAAATVYNITASINDASGVTATRAYGVMNPSVRVIDCSTHGVPRAVNGTASTECSCDQCYSGSACAVTCSGHGLMVEFADVDTTADTHTITVNWGNDALVAAAAAYTSGEELTHTYNEAGTYTITVSIEDNSAAKAVQTNTVTNATLTVLDCSGNGVAQFENSVATCDCNHLHSGATCAVVCGAHGTLALNDGATSCVCEKGHRRIECAIGNSAPVITSITRTSSAVSTTGMPVRLTANFTDADDTLDAHIIAVNWGDGTAIVPTSYTTGIELEHTYSAVGVYTVGVTITDASKAAGTRADTITQTLQ